MELSRVQSKRRTKRKSKRKAWLLGLIVIATMVGGYFASYNARLWLAGSLLVTQHHHWAKYTLIPEKKLEELRQDMANPEMENSTTVDLPTTEKEPTEQTASKEPIEIIPVERKISSVHYFKGHAMIVHDPSRVHLVQTTGTKRSGKGLPRGEFISEFVERTGAFAAVNASGFYDPNWMGYGETPSGLVIQDGKILSAATGKGETIVGLTYDGKLITGNYSAEQLVKEMNIRDAVSFKPQLMVNGKNLFAGKEATSWGIAPRTAMGQTKEGAIIFIVIDGRQPTHSLGASMTDMATLMEEFGAVNAMALDGGTSSMMVTKEKILTSSSNDDERGRWLPNAWVVF